MSTTHLPRPAARRRLLRIVPAIAALLIGCVAAAALYAAPAADEAMDGPKNPTAPRSTGSKAGPGMTGKGVPGETAVVPQVKWQTTFNYAAVAARKEDKLIMAYFSGSDWDDFSKKLFKEVLNTPMFIEWANKNVVLFQVDFPSPDVKQSAAVRNQNDKLKQKYNVQRVPTIVFMDADGEPYVTVGYDTAKLRDEEKTGAPLKWLEFADNIVKTKPGQEKLAVEPTFAGGVEKARKKGLPLLMLLTKDTSPRVVEANQQVTGSQKFIRFANRTVLFKPVDWPEDADAIPEAKQLRQFIADHKVGPAPAQFLLFDANQKKVKLKVTAFSPTKIQALVKQITNELPRFDYGGGWLTDFQIASSVAVQLKRELLVAFVSMDGSEWSKKIDEEIFKHPDFREYAGKHLVLCRIDFPKTAPVDPEVKQRNDVLATRYGVRGYPTIVVLNDGGQPIGNAKYQKGGAQPFLQEVDNLRNKDYERRLIMSDQVEIVD